MIAVPRDVREGSPQGEGPGISIIDNVHFVLGPVLFPALMDSRVTVVLTE
jgi:hypothetical protein